MSNLAPRPPRLPKDWDKRWLLMARFFAGMSKDPSTKVGAVAVRDRHVLVAAYNGLPRHVSDTPARLNTREVRLAMTCHAEINLVSQASLHGQCLRGATVYVWPLMVCSHCAGTLIQTDVSRVVIPDIQMPQRWQASFSHAQEMFDEAGIPVIRIDPHEPDTTSQDFANAQPSPL